MSNYRKFSSGSSRTSSVNQQSEAMRPPAAPVQQPDHAAAYQQHDYQSQQEDEKTYRPEADQHDFDQQQQPTDGYELEQANTEADQQGENK